MSQSLSKILSNIIVDRFGNSDPDSLSAKEAYLLRRAEQQLGLEHREEEEEENVYNGANIFGLESDESQRRIELKGEIEKQELTN